MYPATKALSHIGPNGTESFTYRGAEWHRYSANGKTFLYDGDNVLADIAGGTDALYVTPFLDQNLSMTTAAGTYYYSQDGLGSVRTLTDSTGAAVNSYDFLAFGGAHQPGTSVTVEQRYTYTGREKNPESALMYYRYRQYDPRVGRFGARDPFASTYLAMVAFEKRRTLPEHVYVYVSGSPVRLHDIFGLAEIKVDVTFYDTDFFADENLGNITLTRSVWCDGTDVKVGPETKTGGGKTSFWWGSAMVEGKSLVDDAEKKCSYGDGKYITFNTSVSDGAAWWFSAGIGLATTAATSAATGSGEAGAAAGIAAGVFTDWYFEGNDYHTRRYLVCCCYCEDDKTKPTWTEEYHKDKGSIVSEVYHKDSDSGEGICAD